MSSTLTSNSPRLFGAILADPPWSHTPPGRRPVQNRAWFGDHRMTNEEIASLQIPAKPDSVCFLWCLPSNLPVGLDILERWGFRYVSNMVWGKMTTSNSPVMGMGGYLRNSHEHVLIGKRGNPPRMSRSVRSLVLTPPMHGNSRKPWIQPQIEQLTPGPYLEMFGRTEYPGWTVIGSAVTGNDIRKDLYSFYT